MATRANIDTSKALIRTATVKAASSVTRGFPIKRSSGEVLNCTAGDASIGIALESGTAGQIITYAAANGGGMVAVKVGTGGCTEGLYGVAVSDGVTNSGTLGGGTTLVNLVCQFDQTGVAGDLVGAVPISQPSVKALRAERFPKE